MAAENVGTKAFSWGLAPGACDVSLSSRSCPDCEGIHRVHTTHGGGYDEDLPQLAMQERRRG